MSSVLNDQVLVLNRLWQAVNVCSVRRALTLLFEGNAQVVFGDGDGDYRTLNFQQWRDLSDADPEADGSVGTISFRIRVPRVILLLGFDRFPKKEVKFTRHNLFERDRNTCQYCGTVFDRRDCSCIPCNTRKANRTPAEANMRLVRKPKRPKWRPFVQVSFGASMHDSWRHFLDVAYWNVELGSEVG
ncbi:MAG: HNH endonuclease [Verrucomicrobia bacterium]|nr:HNH endonuclease [Verrucomicrobiota bacterium]